MKPLFDYVFVLPDAGNVPEWNAELTFKCPNPIRAFYVQV